MLDTEPLDYTTGSDTSNEAATCNKAPDSEETTRISEAILFILFLVVLNEMAISGLAKLKERIPLFKPL